MFEKKNISEETDENKEYGKSCGKSKSGYNSFVPSSQELPDVPLIIFPLTQKQWKDHEEGETLHLRERNETVA